MPENTYEWMWFIFFTVGSAGGWGFALLFGAIVWQETRKRKEYNARSLAVLTPKDD